MASTTSSKQAASTDEDWENPLWKFVEKLEKIKGGGGNWRFRCNFCKLTFSGSHTRVKSHLLHITGEGIRKCNSVSDVDIETIRKMIDQVEARKKLLTSTGVVNIPLPQCGVKKRKGEKGIDKYYNVKAREEMDYLVARYFYSAGIALSGVMNPVFIQMIKHACDHNLSGYKVPSYERVRTTLMVSEKANLQTILHTIKAAWPRVGVSIVSDGWTDNNKRPLINFLASSSSGPVFLKSIDASGEYKDASYLANLFEDVINEVGVQNVVQIITDNAAVCKLAGKCIEDKHPHIFWTPCVVHTLNLALRDICEPDAKDNNQFLHLNWISQLIDEAKMLRIFVCNHSHARTIFQKYSHLRLLNVAETRFASAITMVRCIKEVKSHLLKMVFDDNWKFLQAQDTEKAQAVKNIVIDDCRWDRVDYFLGFTAPIVHMLRVADSDKPCLHLIYDMWDTIIEKVQQAIEEKNIFPDTSDFYLEVHDILVRRWDKSNTPLHCLAHSLVPKFYSDRWLGEGGLGVKRVPPHRDEEITKGRNKCFDKLFSSQDLKSKVRKEYGYFSGCMGPFLGWESIRDRYDCDASTWWANYGASAPLLASLADMLLNQPTSSSSSERNWSTFSYILNVKRNRLKSHRAEDLVFLHSNLRLLSRREPSYQEGPSKYWDVVAEHIDLDTPIEMDIDNISLCDPVLEPMAVVDDDENTIENIDITNID